jgi:REP element-mobilizing transposase RayT
MIYHALNRANFRSRLFRRDAHYQEFLGVVGESLHWAPMRMLAYGLMPNHWHLVLQPPADGDLSRFLQLLTLTHTQRYHARTRTVGYGHLCQGRYKSFPVESGGHFLTLVRYVEKRPACRSGEAGGGWALVERARPPVGKGGAKAVPQPVAGARTGPLSAVAQSVATPGGNGEDSKSHRKEQTVWLGEVGGTHRGNLRAGKHPAQSRASEKGTK